VEIVLLESQYLPPVAFFSALASAQELLIEEHENFQKQTYRNRCYINTSQGPIPLIVPLVNSSGKTRISEVVIDYSQRWMNNHWRAIQSSYGKAPFFEFYADELHDVVFQKFDRLLELNNALLTLCLKCLKWKLPVRGTLPISPKRHTKIADIYQPAVYQQVFGNKFVENLSLIDLIFCEGPGALGIVHASSPNEHLKGRLRF
jgi:hypothetical protein